MCHGTRPACRPRSRWQIIPGQAGTGTVKTLHTPRGGGGGGRQNQLLVCWQGRGPPSGNPRSSRSRHNCHTIASNSDPSSKYPKAWVPDNSRALEASQIKQLGSSRDEGEGEERYCEEGEEEAEVEEEGEERCCCERGGGRKRVKERSAAAKKEKK